MKINKYKQTNKSTLKGGHSPMETEHVATNRPFPPRLPAGVSLLPQEAYDSSTASSPLSQTASHLGPKIGRIVLSRTG